MPPVPSAACRKVRMENMSSEQEIPRLHELSEFRYQLRTFLSFSEVASEACGIPAQQYQLMQVIGSLPEGKTASISYVADRMILKHNSTVELVDRAERAGLVRRKNDEKDLRRSLVEVTPHGYQILKTLVGKHLEELARRGDAIVEALRRVNGPSGVDHSEQTSQGV